MKQRTFFILFLIGLSPVVCFPQSDKKAADIARLEAAVEAARTKVTINEKKMAAADSIIDAGKKMVDEAKDEIKLIDSESKKFEKEFAVRYKAVKKLTGSKDKAEAKKATTDLRMLDTEHRNTNRTFETRMNNAYKKQASGISTIDKGQKARQSAKTALEASEVALKIAGEKYQTATGPVDERGKGKNK